MREIVLPDNETVKKLENFLKKQFPIGYVRKLFRKNSVRLNGRRAKPEDLVRAGDRIQLYIDFEKPAETFKPRPALTKLDIIYEDNALLVLNKRAGIAVHEGKTVGKRESVLGILETQYRDRGIKPQLVHRLDKDTSGLLLVAKNPESAKELESCFETGAVEKEYLCLLVGRLPNNEGKIDFPLPGRGGNPVRAAHALSRRQKILRSHSRARRHRDRPPAPNPSTLRQARLPGRHGRPARRFRFQ